MLSSLTIRDVVLIEALTLDFAPGLGVLTGETGAGKSILLDSLGLALGARSDAGLVRSGATQASVTASFEIGADHAARRLMTENDLESDDLLILRRQVKADGGSRGYINDQPVSATLLRDVGATLIEIHGQHDDRGLLNARGHRALLDAFGRLDVASVTAAYTGWREAETALATARETLEAGLRDREWLSHAVSELDALKPLPGEEAELAEARSSMMKGQRLAEDMSSVTQLLDGSDGGFAQLRQAARRLERLSGEHELLNEALVALDRTLTEAGEVEDKLAAAAEAMAYDPARLDSVEARLFELRGLARKHRVEPDALADLAAELGARAEAIGAGEERVEKLAVAVGKARAAFEAAAAALSTARAKAAVALDKAVAGELAPLKLDAARFRTVVEPLGEGQWSPSGADRVEFEISTNPGSPFAPLIKIASGGELSRFILALKVALAETKTAGTMIFDEIDRGVGGAVASAIGERLARLAQGTQVLVVTHSPQVAARGDHQWRIAKSSSGEVTRTDVRPLSDAERQEEIARMLSGATVTDEARAQAGKLLARSEA
ncbi:DNA repair protein RecN [Sphingoaurantiacus capsulatus]|uniref:DNA repair protein RecN n=1 Tax=Sphingoaurantiacus capsulatus TaxID=1771310 RepID=A0ABV7XDS3_9SPHN